MKKKIYIFCNSNENHWYNMQALSEDGYNLTGETSFELKLGKYAMGIGSDKKHDVYDKHFGKGKWELIWIDKPLTDAEFQIAYQLNVEMGQLATHEILQKVNFNSKVMTKEQKSWIDNAPYGRMLYRMRKNKAGDRLLHGEVGEYFRKRLQEKKDALGPEMAEKISQGVGML